MRSLSLLVVRESSFLSDIARFVGGAEKEGGNRFAVRARIAGAFIIGGSVGVSMNSS
jgi:hypothetical protein